MLPAWLPNLFRPLVFAAVVLRRQIMLRLRKNRLYEYACEIAGILVLLIH